MDWEVFTVQEKRERVHFLVEVRYSSLNMLGMSMLKENHILPALLM